MKHAYWWNAVDLVTTHHSHLIFKHIEIMDWEYVDLAQAESCWYQGAGGTGRALDNTYWWQGHAARTKVHPVL